MLRVVKNSGKKSKTLQNSENIESGGMVSVCQLLSTSFTILSTRCELFILKLRFIKVVS